MCVCVCVYISLYVCVYVCMYLCVYLYMYMYMYVFVCVCVCVIYGRAVVVSCAKTVAPRLHPCPSRLAELGSKGACIIHNLHISTHITLKEGSRKSVLCGVVVGSGEERLTNLYSLVRLSQF